MFIQYFSGSYKEVTFDSIIIYIRIRAYERIKSIMYFIIHSTYINFGAGVRLSCSRPFLEGN